MLCFLEKKRGKKHIHPVRSEKQLSQFEGKKKLFIIPSANCCIGVYCFHVLRPYILSVHNVLVLAGGI